MNLAQRTVVLLGVCSCLLGATNQSEQDTVVMSKEQWMALQVMFGEQAQAMQNEINEKFYWYDGYHSLAQCIRQQTNKGELSGVCIGDVPA